MTDWWWADDKLMMSWWWVDDVVMMNWWWNEGFRAVWNNQTEMLGLDWVGLDEISLNRLTTRSPYGDNKQPARKYFPKLIVLGREPQAWKMPLHSFFLEGKKLFFAVFFLSFSSHFLHFLFPLNFLSTSS